MKKNILQLVFGVLLTALSARASMTPVDLRCDYAVNPLGVDSANPRLFCKLEATGRGEKQSAYEIIVASSKKTLSAGHGDLWESGKVDSDETIQIPYGGAALKSSEQVYWKVRSWDGKGKVSGWSAPATWTMGVLADSDWRGKWITAADTNFATLLLRREFVVRPDLVRALVNVCGLGQYELNVNGAKAGDDVLSPGWTKYDKTCLYDTRDLTSVLHAGKKNAVGITLGTGMYHVTGNGTRFVKFKGSFGPLKAIAQIRLEYADGSVDVIGTDEQWRTSPGPITFSSIYGGEDFDARLVQHGWDKPGFDDSKWANAQIVEGPGGKLKGLSCSAPPIREFEIHPGHVIGTVTNGDMVYDFGQNASHVPQICVTGPAGSSIRLTPSELVHEDGSVNQSSMGVGRRGGVWCDYTKATDGEEKWSPQFFYVGCRYVQVHFTPANTNGELPRVKSLNGIVIQSASEPVGEFECSNTLFNRIRQLVRWAQRSNMESLMTDCPHRERLGWLEEDHLNGPALRYEYDLAQLFTKTMNDIADSQLTNGLVPTTAPEYTIFGRDATHLRGAFGDSPEWSSTFIIVPWQQYEFDGDLNLFRKHYDAMTNYLAYFGSRAENYIANFGLGDWYDIGPKGPGVSQLTPISLTATAFYFQDVEIMSRVAALLGKNEDAKMYSELAGKIRAAFNEKFYNASKHTYATGSQCANSIPLVMNICEPANRAGVVDSIVQDVRSRGNALTAGDVGYRYLLRALADGGRSDVIFDMNNQSDKPGYGMQLAKGKTSLTEAWNGGSSQDHFMLGQIQEWFYHDLAGIQSARNGFKEIIIAPQPVGDVTWTKASYQSIRGKITGEWKRTANEFALNIAIPANTTATVFVPANSAGTVTVNGKAAGKIGGANLLRMDKNRAVFSVESGEYKFKSRL